MPQIGYATPEELTAYAAARGYTLTKTPEIDLQLGLDYIESFEPNLDGQRADPNQLPSWPRTMTQGVPLAVKQAQMVAAMEADKGMDFFPTQSGAVMKRDKTGPLETEWFEGTETTVSVPQIDGLMAPFLKNSGFFLNVVRV
jgi:hypothetical protein